MWELLVSLTYFAAGLDLEDEVGGRIVSSLREASSIASLWASRAPPSPTVNHVLSRMGEWVEEAAGRVRDALRSGRVSEAREEAELLLATVKNTHSILMGEASRYKMGFQLPLTIDAVVMAAASIMGMAGSITGLLASITGFVFMAAGAAASSISPRTAIVSLLVGGAIVFSAMPPLSIAGIVGAGMASAILAYMGLESRRVRLILPEPGRRGAAPPEQVAVSEEEAWARLEAKYRELYGDQWKSILEYDINMLVRTGLSRREAVLRRLRELEG